MSDVTGMHHSNPTPPADVESRPVDQSAFDTEPSSRGLSVSIVTLWLLLIVAGAYLRFEGLGVASLWRDELCTWHVSRMAVGESLRWGPELSKPPLYQFVLRGLTDDPHPSEWTLRLPAAVCGLLTILAAGWLGMICGGPIVGASLAGLLAFHDLQIEYSQEARPYSLLVLGCTLSTALWYQLVTTRRRGYGLAYVLVTTLTLYAHYLAGLTVAAHFLWWVWRARRQITSPFHSAPFVSLIATGLLSVPLVARYLVFKTSLFQGLEWIKPPTLVTAFEVLERLTFGWQWPVGLLLPAFVLWIAGAWGCRPRRFLRSAGPLFAGRDDPTGLLFSVFMTAWFGLLVLSWTAHPALVPRYALPAAVPAILIPLLMANRFHRLAPTIVMVVFILGALPSWTDREVDPGIREMVVFLEENMDAQREAVVLTLDNTIYPGWEDSERIIFDYYPLRDAAVVELRLGPDGVTDVNQTLADPRGLWVIVLWADPFPVLEAAGRRPIPIELEGRSYSQLNFPPYRLVRVAPK